MIRKFKEVIAWVKIIFECIDCNYKILTYPKWDFGKRIRKAREHLKEIYDVVKSSKHDILSYKQPLSCIKPVLIAKGDILKDEGGHKVLVTTEPRLSTDKCFLLFDGERCR